MQHYRLTVSLLPIVLRTNKHPRAEAYNFVFCCGKIYPAQMASFILHFAHIRRYETCKTSYSVALYSLSAPSSSLSSLQVRISEAPVCISVSKSWTLSDHQTVLRDKHLSPFSVNSAAICSTRRQFEKSSTEERLRCFYFPSSNWIVYNST